MVSHAVNGTRTIGSAAARLVTLASLLVGVGCGWFELASRQTVYDFASHLAEARSIVEEPFVDVGNPAQHAALLSGWADPETNTATGQTFAWATATDATVVLSVLRQDFGRLDFRCWPFAFQGAPSQKVSVEVNGLWAGEVTLENGPAWYSVPLTDGMLRFGQNVVTFRFAYTAVPRDHGATDPRTLAVAFEAVSLASADGPRAGHALAAVADPQPTEDGFALSPGHGVVFTLQAPEDGVLDVSLVPIAGETRGSVQAVAWLRSVDGTIRALQSVEVAAGRRARMRVPLQVPAGETIQIGFAVAGRSSPTPTGSVVEWREPRLYGHGLAATTAANVVLIVVDTLRADHVGAYGSTVQTPNIDALASRGVLFGNAYCHIPITGPSHATLFTSLLPSEHGVHNNTHVLDAGAVTLAEILGFWGRSTTAFVSLGVLKRQFGLSQGFDEYHDAFANDWMKDARELNVEVTRWLAETPRRPFFLWVHYSDPHEPYTPPNLSYPQVDVTFGGRSVASLEAHGRGVGFPVDVPPGRHTIRLEPGDPPPTGTIRFPLIRLADTDLSIRPGSGWTRFEKRYGPEAFDTTLPATLVVTNSTGRSSSTELILSCKELLTTEEVRQRYAQEVAFVDHEIGLLMSALEGAEMLDNSLIVFVSDHGEALGDHGHIGHISQLYDTLIRVPLIFVYPGRIPAGRVVEDRVGLVDVAPTVAELLGLRLESGTRGRSLVPLLEGGEPPVRPIVAETYRPEAYSDKLAIVTGGFKYIWSRRDHEWVEVYDLAKDPDELNDLSQERPELVSELRRALEREVETSQRSPAIAANISADDAAQLRALGYVH